METALEVPLGDKENDTACNSNLLVETPLVEDAAIRATPVKEPWGFDETLIKCNVCLDMLHNPVNCSPCNHKFCASCIYRWLDRNFGCPKCRNTIKEATRDKLVEELVVGFLETHPEYLRCQDDIDGLDKLELEYLEKLWGRLRAPIRRLPYTDQEFDMLSETEMRDVLAAYYMVSDNIHFAEHAPQRRLFLGSAKKYRESEWETRLRVLRAKFHAPAPQPPPIPRPTAQHPPAPPAPRINPAGPLGQASTSHAPTPFLHLPPLHTLARPEDILDVIAAAVNTIEANEQAVQGQMLAPPQPLPHAQPQQQNGRRRRNRRDPSPREPYELRRRRL